MRAAKQIVKAWSSDPDALMYVIFGDLHLAPAHLPSAVKKELARNGKFNSSFKVNETTVHLNSEHVYFELAKRDLELSTEVVKFSDEKFCVLSTPPWVKWQSYLLFLDRALTSKAETDSYETDPDEDDADFDPTDQVALLIRLASTDLGLQSDFKTINDLAVYSEDDEMIWREVSQRTDRVHRKQAEELLQAGRAFFLPEGGVAYLPKPTINAAASLAGLYLHARYSKRKRPLWNFPGDIRAAIWTEAVSYFISKLINHSRRSETVSSLRSKMSDQSQNVEALKLALDIRLSEILRLQGRRKTRTLKTRPRQKSSYLEASRILGGMLGERLYLAYRSRKLKRELLLKWLRKNPASKAFAVFYDVIIREVASW